MDDRRILVMIPILFLALLHVGSAAPVFKKASVTEAQSADAILTEEGKVGKTPQPFYKEIPLGGVIAGSGALAFYALMIAMICMIEQPSKKEKALLGAPIEKKALLGAPIARE